MKSLPSDKSTTFDRVMDGLLAVPYTELQKKLEEEKHVKSERKKRAKPKPASPASSDRKSES
jgi:hypothetical protein